MASKYFNLPKDLQLKSILGMLYQGLEISAGAPIDLSAAGTYFGVYVNDAGEPVALSVADTNLSAYASCALTMLPPGVANDAALKCVLDEIMEGNLYEVFNIMSRLFMAPHTGHLKLDKLYTYDDLPESITQIMDTFNENATFEIDVPRYGTGQLNMLIQGP